MNMIKISPSLLEEYRLTCDEAFGKNSDTLKEYILGEYEPNLYKSRGTAWHWCIENAREAIEEFDSEHIIVHEPEMDIEWKFGEKYRDFLVKHLSRFESASHEVKAHEEFDFGFIKVVSLFRVDMIEGVNVFDHKTSSSHSYDKYINSLQLKLYACSLEPQNVIVNAFKMPKINSDKPNYTVEKFEYTPYVYQYDFTQARQEVKEAMSGFISWASNYPEIMKKLSYSAEKAVKWSGAFS